MARVIVFKQTRSNPMKATLLLNDESETARLMLKDVAFDPVKVRETEAVAGCNCDRWGHPCSGCDEREVQMKAQVPISSLARRMK
jgi:hypothetical protein